MEQSPGLPPGAPQVHEHRRTDEPGGGQVGLRRSRSMGVGGLVLRERAEEEMSHVRFKLTPVLPNPQGNGIQRDSTLLMSIR